MSLCTSRQAADQPLNVQFAVYLPGMARHWQESQTPKAAQHGGQYAVARASEQSPGRVSQFAAAVRRALVEE
jgi:hypothetical protein